MPEDPYEPYYHMDKCELLAELITKYVERYGWFPETVGMIMIDEMIQWCAELDGYYTEQWKFTDSDGL